MQTCAVCQRASLKANWKSHSNAKTIRRQKLNLQTKTIDGKKLTICTSCIRTLVKPKVEKKKAEVAK